MPVVHHRLEERQSTATRRSSGGGRALRIVPRNEPAHDDYSSEVVRAVAHVARAYRLSTTEAEDLRSDVWVKLLERQGRVQRRFAERTPIGPYLVTVAKNLLLDRRNKEWGKWRPSRAAHRAGPLGIALDRLLTRDGWSLDAAEQSLRTAGVVHDGTSVIAIAASLPMRCKRAFVEIQVLESVASTAPNPHEAMDRQQRRRDERRLEAALANAVATLSLTDRQLLVWRFVDGMTIAAMAPRVRVEAKILYRHFGRLMRHLRGHLETNGIDSTTVRAALTEPSPRFGGALAMPASPTPLLRWTLA